MVTKRTPVRPPRGPRITPAAIAAFREMETLVWGSEKWLALDRVLSEEMKLFCWEFPTYAKGGNDVDAMKRYILLRAAADAAG
jgi:hypothetical protein